MASVLDIRGLSHRIGDRPVLQDVSLEVEPGEIVGLLGPNGSGKSTLLGLLTGRWRPAPGTVRFEGEPMERVRRRFAAQLGVVFQQPALDGKLTARQNLRLAAMLHALPADEAAERVAEGLADAELTARADEPVETFSGGMRRHPDVARALLPRPRVLLLDEPTTGLDEASFRALWGRLLPRIREQRLAVLVATHRPDEAARCDRLLLLHGGRVVREATPEALLQEVGRDLVVLHGDDPDGIVRRVAEWDGALAVERVGAEVQIVCEDGSTLLPAVLAQFAPGEIAMAALRRPSLADVFARLTGETLDGAAAPGEALAS